MIELLLLLAAIGLAVLCILLGLTFHTGQGGTVTVGGAAFTAISTWKYTKTATLAETTNAGSGGWQTRLLVVKGGTFALDFVWDSDNIPETNVAVDIGQAVTVALKLGDTALKYTFPGIVETIE